MNEGTRHVQRLLADVVSTIRPLAASRPEGILAIREALKRVDSASALMGEVATMVAVIPVAPQTRWHNVMGVVLANLGKMQAMLMDWDPDVVSRAWFVTRDVRLLLDSSTQFDFYELPSRG